MATTFDNITLVQKNGTTALDATDVSEFSIGQILLDVSAGRIYAIKSTDGTNNGDRIYWWAYDGYINLAFTVSSFTDNQSSPQLIGSGQWKLGTALTFTIAYANGPPDSSSIASSSWAADLTLTTPFTSGTGGTNQNTNWPASVGGNVTYTVTGVKSGSPNSTKNASVTFYNHRCNGLDSKASGYTSTDINNLSSRVVTSGKNGTFTFSPAAGEYIIIAYRKSLGTSTFTVGGFPGGFESPETVSMTNDNSFVEDYYVYRSTNHSLASGTEVVVS
jgi:hypothetical protein